MRVEAGSTVNKAKLLTDIADNPKLPTFPPIALRVLDRASQPNCGIGELEEIITKDPVLCGKILRVANSALFGMTRQVKSIKQALNLLGTRQVRSLVLTFAMPSVRGLNGADSRAADFWKISLASALISRELATRFQNPEPETELVAGLLCDLGILILQEVYPNPMATIASHPAEELALNRCSLEESLLGINHAEVAAFVLDRWRLPAEITEPIAAHHRPESLVNATPEIVHRSYSLYFATKLAELQVTPRLPQIHKQIVDIARDRFGLSEPDLGIFLAPITRKMEEFASVMQVNLGACVEFPELLSRATKTLTALAQETRLENVCTQDEVQRARDEWKTAMVSLRQAQEQMQQAKRLEAVGHLASGIAHDFRNYLTAITGYCDLLSNSHSVSDPSHELIDQIKRAGDKAGGLISQLLSFARRQEPESVSVNLNDVIRNMDKVLRCLLGERSQVEIAIDPDLPPVNGNPGQFDQVIMNLAINARDAMPNGGIVSITTGRRDLDGANQELPRGAYVVLTVSDTGCGMDEQTKAHIFDPFFSTKDVGKGTGLGLSTAREIIEQLHGRICVESAIGEGTKFEIFIPTAEAATCSEARTRIIRPPAESATPTILIAEDEELVRGLARRTLESSGYTILEARNGLEALVMGQEHNGPIHLLFTDAMMPLLPGCELAKRLRDSRPGLKVLYTTGHTPESLAKLAPFPAETPYLPKPFSPQALVGKIRDVLQVSSI